MSVRKTHRPRKVRGSRKDDRVRKVGLVQMSFGFFCALLMLLGLRVLTIHKAYQVEALRGQLLELDSRRREMSLELSLMMRPDALLSRAHSQLGMQELSPQQVRNLGFSESLYVAATNLSEESNS